MVKARVNGKDRGVVKSKGRGALKDKVVGKDRRAAANPILCRLRSGFRAWDNRAATPVRDVGDREARAGEADKPDCTVRKACRGAGLEVNCFIGLRSITCVSNKAFLTTIWGCKVGRSPLAGLPTCDPLKRMQDRMPFRHCSTHRNRL